MSPRSRELAGKTVEIAACGGKRARPARKAKLDLRAGWVKLAPPLRPARSAGRREPLDVLAVTATEPNPPAGKEPLHWVLLTTEGSADAETAKTVLAWYERRWTIEEYFRVLKTGTRVEDRRLDHADDLRKCLAFDAITACPCLRSRTHGPRQTGHPRQPGRRRRRHRHPLRQADGIRHPSRTSATRKTPGHPHLGHRHRKARRLPPKKKPAAAGKQHCSGKDLSTCETPPTPYRALKKLDMIKH